MFNTRYHLSTQLNDSSAFIIRLAPRTPPPIVALNLPGGDLVSRNDDDSLEFGTCRHAKRRIFWLRDSISASRVLARVHAAISAATSAREHSTEFDGQLCFTSERIYRKCIAWQKNDSKYANCYSPERHYYCAWGTSKRQALLENWRGGSNWYSGENTPSQLISEYADRDVKLEIWHIVMRIDLNRKWNDMQSISRRLYGIVDKAIRDDSNLRYADSEMTSCLRRHGICFVDARGWLYSNIFCWPSALSCECNSGCGCPEDWSEGANWYQ